MKSKKLFLVFGLMMSMAIYADTKPAEGIQKSPTSQIAPRLHAPELRTDFFGPDTKHEGMKPLSLQMEAEAKSAEQTDRATWGKGKNLVRINQENGVREHCDSIVSYDNNNQISQIEYMGYDQKVRPIFYRVFSVNSAGEKTLTSEQCLTWTDNDTYLTFWHLDNMETSSKTSGEKEEFVYDENNPMHITQHCIYIYTKGEWIPNIKVEYEYDDAGNTTSETYSVSIVSKIN